MGDRAFLAFGDRSTWPPPDCFLGLSLSLYSLLFFMFSFSSCQYLVLDVIPYFNAECHRLHSCRVAEGLFP
jgi:hypothetical protein